MANQIARIVSLPGLLLLVSTASWAGRGDIDPNYGEGGRVSAVSAVLLALPGDRLVIADAATEEGLRVRMVDATGQNVLDFGTRGVVRIAHSAAAASFWPEAAALAQNGDMIFAGSLHTGARELMRLDKAGRPVVSFGTRRDGFVELALTTIGAMAFAVDPDGKIFIAEGSSNPLGHCGSPARLQRLLANGQPDIEFGVDGIVEIPNLDLCQGVSLLDARSGGGVIVGHGHAIVSVDAAGEIDRTFGVDGWLTVTDSVESRFLQLPDGDLLIVGSDTVTGSSDTLFRRFVRNGQPDLDFGYGTGLVTVDLGTELLGMPSAREYVRQLALDPDGEHVLAELHLSVSSDNGDARVLCSGIARLSIDGTPDADFGRNGLTCLNLNFALIAVQGDGAALVNAGYWSDSIYRLLPDNTPSPGFLTIVAAQTSVGETQGTVAVSVERLAGRDGAVSANFATFGLRVGRYCGYRVCYTDVATAGSDYTATSGRLDWANGDDSQRTITIRVLDDDIDEITETFGLGIADPGGDILLIAEDPTFFLVDDETAPPPAPPSGGGTSAPSASGPAPASGGGGSVSWTTPLALLTLLFLRCRPRTRPGVAVRRTG